MIFFFKIEGKEISLFSDQIIIKFSIIGFLTKPNSSEERSNSILSLKLGQKIFFLHWGNP